jgi:hypothetical protein
MGHLGPLKRNILHFVQDKTSYWARKSQYAVFCTMGGLGHCEEKEKAIHVSHQARKRGSPEPKNTIRSCRC